MPAGWEGDENLPLRNLLWSLYEKWGYDFRNYSPAHLNRRIRNRMNLSGFSTVDRLREAVVESEQMAARLIQDLSIGVTEMFRDPDFFQAMREKVVPLLKTWPHLNIWHAGCASGEEAYSMSIVLKEEGIGNRALIYATDFNQVALDRAREGIYPDERIREYTRNYQRSGAQGAFSDYFSSRYDSAIMDPALKKNIVWANHNLATDSVFAEVHLILCRNVLIYFNAELQNRVHALFFESLVRGGILCLGLKESLRFSPYAGRYVALDRSHRIFQKRYDS